jgi:hypothetical protein
MPAFLDRTGHRFGRLTVEQRATNAGRRVRWVCRCDCGAVVTVLASSLGKTTFSCGCLGIERRCETGRNMTHGMCKTRAYRSWAQMRSRCLNRNEAAYPRYGGRGITICERWMAFENFIADMGPCPDGLEIERLDVNGGYEPSNCVWATLIEQANNKRNNRMVVSTSRLETVAQLAGREGIKYSTAYYRHVIRGNAPSRAHLVQMEHPEQLSWE